VTDKIWLEDEHGNTSLVSYEDLDEEFYPRLWKPTGGFAYEAGAFMHLPLPRVPFYIKDWLPKQGKAEIYGQAKSGKSFLCMQIARSIGQGRPLFGIPTNQGVVLYLQFELGVAVLQYRMRLTGHTYENVFVGTSFSMKLDKKEGQDSLLHELEAIHPDVLILDPFYKIIDGDENEAQDVKVVTNFLDQVIDAYGLSVLVLHHSGKDFSKGGRGSSVLEGWVDSYIAMNRINLQDETTRAKIVPKLLRHAQTPPEPFELVLGDDFEFYVGEKALTVKDKVELYIQEHETVSVREMVDTGIGSRKSVYDARTALIEEGLVVEAGRGQIAWKGKETDENSD